MRLNEYQSAASKTHQKTAANVTEPVVPLLGLAGEAGELLSQYKKYLRDADAHLVAKDRIAEELGDLLWYLADTASVFGLTLEDIANANLAKINDRWGTPDSTRESYLDEEFPENERLPRTFEVQFVTTEEGDQISTVMLVHGEPLGTQLTDNSHKNDGYRFHDVFHLSCAASLGWSPVIRALMKRKRKSAPKIDEVEDGGRATAIEEGIAALVFSYAEAHNYMQGINSLDYELLRTIRSMTRNLEVSRRSTREWEKAILNCYAIWREIQKSGGGRVRCDMNQRRLLLLA
jgi:NTP pyrophosphatase (non-canonical NTP hydrolase)